MIKRLFFIFIALCFLCGMAFSTDYYVKPTGNDSNTGQGTTDGLAWLTITKANNTLTAGDTVYIMAGTYSTNDGNAIINPDNNGTSGSPITYTNYSTDTVILRSISNSSLYKGAQISKNYITIDGLEFDNIDQQQSLMEYGINIASNKNNIIIQNCTIQYLKEYWTAGADSCGISLGAGCTYCQILDNTIRYCGRNNNNSAGHGIKFQEASGVAGHQYNLVQGNTLSHGGHACILIKGQYNVIRDNTISNPWEKGVDLLCDRDTSISGYNLFEDNISYENRTPNRIHGTGLEIIGLRNIIRRNRFYSNDALGIELRGDSRRDSNYNHIFHNIFYNNGLDSNWNWGISINDMGNGGYVDDTIIKNNINYDNDATGIYYILCSAGDMTLSDNWWDSDGDPQFTDAPSGDFTTADASGTIDNGGWLTTITSATGSGTSFVVADAGYFCDGHNITTGDEIQLQGVATSVTVTEVNYSTDTITVDSSQSWTKDVTGVALQYYNAAPDQGWYEHPVGDPDPDISAYYVDADAAAGGNGSTTATTGANCAFDAIADVNAASLVAGDVVSFQKGDEFRDRLEITWSGSSGSPIIFTSYGSGAKPIINGSSVETTWVQSYNTTSVISNSGFETAGGGGADVFANWYESVAGTSTVNDDTDSGDYHGGAHGCRLDIDGSNSKASISQNHNLVAGEKYRLTFWYKHSAAVHIMRIQLKDQANNVYLQDDESSWGSDNSIALPNVEVWTEKVIDFTAHASYTAYALALRNHTATSSSIYIDDVTIQKDVDNVYEKTFSNNVLVVVEDDTVLTLIDFDTDAETTFSGASSGSWSNNTTTAYVLCTDDADPDTHTMEVGANTGSDTSVCRIVNQDYITIDGLEFRYATQYGLLIRNNVADSTSYITVQNCTFYLNGECGIQVIDNEQDGTEGGSYHTFDTNTFSYNRQHGIHLSHKIHHSTISNNTVHHNGWGGTDAADGGHGISSWSDDGTAYPHDNTIEKNTAYLQYVATDGTEGTGIHADGYTKDTIYRYNKSYDNEGSGFTDNGQSGNKWYYNLGYGNAKHASVGDWNGGLAANGCNGTLIYNNVFYDNKNGIAIFDASNVSVTIKNNILSENDEYEIREGVGADTGWASDYNFVYHSGGGTFMRWEASDYNWADWKTNSSQDANASDSDPTMTDPANDDFTIPDTSPCIDAGVDVSLTRDYAGDAVPLGTAPDVGAYEMEGEEAQAGPIGMIIFFSMNFGGMP